VIRAFGASADRRLRDASHDGTHQKRGVERYLAVMVDLGGDFNKAFRDAALDSTAPASDQREHRHFPGARRQLTGWNEDGSGKWSASGVDEHHWEVFCAECGDTDGPAELQSSAVQTLRGPYRSEHHAKHGASKHFEEN
jgi:hypothetical protein